jgi:hypothetical protein
VCFTSSEQTYLFCLNFFLCIKLSSALGGSSIDWFSGLLVATVYAKGNVRCTELPEIIRVKNRRRGRCSLPLLVVAHELRPAKPLIVFIQRSERELAVSLLEG